MALELAVEELRKGKMPIKPNSLSNPLFLKIQGKDIPPNVKNTQVRVQLDYVTL